MATPETLVPLGIAPHLRPLPSAGVTRHPRSYGPLRHPAGPTCPSRAVGWRVPRHQPGLPVLRPFPSSMRAAANTPAEPVGACVVRFPTGDSLPRYQGGSASASNLSRPARRSLALRPAWSLSRPWRPVTSECFRRCRCLHHPLRLLPAGATVAGRDSHPLKNGALHGAPDKPSYVVSRATDRRWRIFSISA